MGKKAQKTPQYKQSLDRVIELSDRTGLPWPQRPKDFGDETYEFPQDITVLSPKHLGRLQSRLAGWDGYVQRLLGLADVDLDLMQNSFNILLAEKMSMLQSNGSSRKLKDTLKAQALSEVPELKEAAYGLAEKAALVKMLKAQKSIYDTQRHAASREQSRRADELRMRPA
ncbi:hypothetical protein LCGC14_1589130 [marine sediment metagenome]|uniref:Uncharacterized protein n=1 Tax=marine sediment metagenome TaxID=412755 RepID=A0A0F9LEZ9_9ZZZZ